MVFGDLPDRVVALGFDAQGDGRVALDRWRGLTWVLGADGAPSDVTVPEAISVPMADAAGRAVATLEAAAAVFERPPAASLAPGGAGGVGALTGTLATQALIDAVIGVGAFDAAGAREAVAGVLGFTPDTLPDATPLRLEWDIPAQP